MRATMPGRTDILRGNDARRVKGKPGAYPTPYAASLVDYRFLAGFRPCPLDAARELDLGAYADLLDAERIVGNLHRAYAELDGAPPGAPIDIVTALTDMVAYNGGQPLTCYA
jgi:hypothetical protein